jgi:hypothetical protein
LTLHILCIHKEFATFIDTSFPADAGVEYAKDYTSGPTLARPWMMNWDEMAGNKGLVLKDAQKSLLTLILCQGFRANPDRFVGVEKIYVGPPVQEVFDMPQTYATIGHPMNAFESHCTKGWTRMTTLMFLLHAVKSLDLLEEIQSNVVVFNSFASMRLERVAQHRRESGCDDGVGIHPIETERFQSPPPYTQDGKVGCQHG